LVDYLDKRTKFELKNNVDKIVIKVLTGDEVATVYYTDAIVEILDSCDTRSLDFYVDGYVVEKDEIKKFSELEGDTYDRAEKWHEYEKTRNERG